MLQEVMDIFEKNMMTFGGLMVLVSKTNVKEEQSEKELKEVEEGFILNSNNKAVVCLSNNRVKKLCNKPISGNFKNNSDKKPISNFGTG